MALRLLIGGFALISTAMPANAFETFCRWPGTALPVPYRIDTSELTDLPVAVAEAAIIAGFDAWRQPSCTGWRSRYDGPIVEELGGPSNVVRFLESEWPAEFGNPAVVIAITLPVTGGAAGSCAIENADIALNSFGWSFVDGDPGALTGNVADLQEIAAHESGHFLGLLHSPFPDSTMSPVYGSLPFLALRDLAQDDVDAVCSLYPRTTTTCSIDPDCSGGELCLDGQCEPLCVSDASCGTGRVCESGLCVPASDCEVCRSCDDDGDCGAGSCVVIGPELEDRACLVVGCTGDGDCPGDSACFVVGDTGFCINPDVETRGPCPDEYLCADSGGDLDGDGVADAVDACPLTAPGEIVDPADGCSLAELCPCTGSGSGEWNTHGDYVACVASAATRFRELRLLSGRQRGAAVAAAARSHCGGSP